MVARAFIGENSRAATPTPARPAASWARRRLAIEAAGRLGSRRSAVAEMRCELSRRFVVTLMLASTIILAEAVSARAPEPAPDKLESAAPPATVNAPAFVLPPPPPSDVLIRTRIRIG
jgi:hypothetical protein